MTQEQTLTEIQPPMPVTLEEANEWHMQFDESGLADQQVSYDLGDGQGSQEFFLKDSVSKVNHEDGTRTPTVVLERLNVAEGQKADVEIPLVDYLNKIKQAESEPGEHGKDLAEQSMPDDEVEKLGELSLSGADIAEAVVVANPELSRQDQNVIYTNLSSLTMAKQESARMGLRAEEADSRVASLSRGLLDGAIHGSTGKLLVMAAIDLGVQTQWHGVDNAMNMLEKTDLLDAEAREVLRGTAENIKAVKHHGGSEQELTSMASDVIAQALTSCDRGTANGKDMQAMRLAFAALGAGLSIGNPDSFAGLLNAEMQKLTPK